MIPKDEITLNGNSFTIKYFDDESSIQDFTPDKMPPPRKFNGLIEVYFSPPRRMKESQCKEIFEACNEELLTNVLKIITRYPNLYSNFNIGKEFTNFECSMYRIDNENYVS